MNGTSTISASGVSTRESGNNSRPSGRKRRRTIITLAGIKTRGPPETDFSVPSSVIGGDTTETSQQVNEGVASSPTTTPIQEQKRARLNDTACSTSIETSRAQEPSQLVHPNNETPALAPRITAFDNPPTNGNTSGSNTTIQNLERRPSTRPRASGQDVTRPVSKNGYHSFIHIEAGILERLDTAIALAEEEESILKEVDERIARAEEREALDELHDAMDTLTTNEPTNSITGRVPASRNEGTFTDTGTEKEPEGAQLMSGNENSSARHEDTIDRHSQDSSNKSQLPVNVPLASKSTLPSAQTNSEETVRTRLTLPVAVSRSSSNEEQTANSTSPLNNALTTSEPPHRDDHGGARNQNTTTATTSSENANTNASVENSATRPLSYRTSSLETMLARPLPAQQNDPQATSRLSRTNTATSVGPPALDAPLSTSRPAPRGSEKAHLERSSTETLANNDFPPALNAPLSTSRSSPRSTEGRPLLQTGDFPPALNAPLSTSRPPPRETEKNRDTQQQDPPATSRSIDGSETGASASTTRQLSRKPGENTQTQDHKNLSTADESKSKEGTTGRSSPLALNGFLETSKPPPLESRKKLPGPNDLVVPTGSSSRDSNDPIQARSVLTTNRSLSPSHETTRPPAIASTSSSNQLRPNGVPRSSSTPSPIVPTTEPSLQARISETDGSVNTFPATRPEKTQEKITLKLSRIVPKIGSSALFTEEEFERDVVDVYKRNSQEASDLNATLAIDQDNSDQYKLDVGAQDATVLENFKSKVEAWVNYRIKFAKLHNLLSDSRSLVLDLSLVAGRQLGVAVTKTPMPVTEEVQGGVWFETVSKKGEMERVLGEVPCMNGAALLAVEGSPCGTAEAVRDLVTAAGKEKKVFTLTVCLPRDADLSTVDTSRMNLRRLTAKDDRGKYEWLEYPPPEFIPTSSLPAEEPKTVDDRKLAIRQLLNDGKTVEVDFVFPSSERIGANLFFAAPEPAGWLHNIKPSGRLYKTVGAKICEIGFGLFKCNGQLVTCLQDYHKAKLKPYTKSEFELTLAFFDGVDLSGIDRSAVLRPPRRRNGEPYPLHLVPPPPMQASPDAIEKSSTLEYKKRKRGHLQEGSAPDSSKRPSNLSNNNHSIPNEISKQKGVNGKSVDPTVGAPAVIDNGNGHTVPRSNDREQQMPLEQNQENPEQALQTTSSRETPPVSGPRRSTIQSPSTIPMQSVNNTAAASADKNDSDTLRIGSSTVRDPQSMATETLDSIPPHAIPLPVSHADTITTESGFGAPFQSKSTDSKDVGGKGLEVQEQQEESLPSHSTNLGAPAGLSNATSDSAQAVEYPIDLVDTDSDNDIRPTNLGDSCDIPSGTQRRWRIQAKAKNNQLLFPKASNALPRPIITVTFDSTKPLGAYFVSVGKTCQVFSVWYSGQVARDSRIRAGMVVDAAFVGQRKQKLRSHRDLKQVYEEARKSRVKLRVVFQSPGNSEVGASDPGVHDKDWSFDGKWIGEEVEGWSGGTELPPGYGDSRFTGPILGIERASSLEASSRAATTPLEALSIAVSKESCAELIEFLQSAVGNDRVVTQRGLQQCYNEVKTNLIAVSDALQRNPLANHLIQQEDDLIAKKKVLNIYINATLCIEKAMALQHWVRYEIQASKANVLLSNEPSSRITVHGRIQLRIGSKSEELGNLPACEIPGDITFAQVETKAVKVTNNIHLAMERRHLIIELHEGDVTESSRVLCAFQLPLNQLGEQNLSHGSSQTVKIPVSTNKRVSEGFFEIEVSRIALERDYIQRKGQEAIKMLSQQAENIARFNTENKVRGKPQLAPNVRGKDGMSLLHAAVHLRRKDLVARLLDIGADAATESSLGTPGQAALAARERTQEKIDKLREAGADEAEIRSKSELLNEFDEMIKMLP